MNRPTSRFRHPGVLLGLAKVVLLFQCIGMYFQINSGGAVQTMLLMDYGFPPDDAKLGENLFGQLILILGVWCFFKPKEYLLYLLLVLFGFYALVIQLQGGTPGAAYTLYAHMGRIVVPVFIICCLSANAEKLNLGYMVLLVGLSITFFTHGVEALFLHAHFIDYLISTADNLIGYSLAQRDAEILLKVIGLADVAVALMALFWQRKEIFVWMCLWGLVTALARITSYGIGLYPDVLVRTVHFIGPFFLLVMRDNGMAAIAGLFPDRVGGRRFFIGEAHIIPWILLFLIPFLHPAQMSCLQCIC